MFLLKWLLGYHFGCKGTTKNAFHGLCKAGDSEASESPWSGIEHNGVMRLAMNWMEQPYKAEVASETNATDTVRQVVYVIQAKDKFTVLYNHIGHIGVAQAECLHA